MTQPPNSIPGIGRRLASMLYETLLLVAVLFTAAFLFIAIARDATSPAIRPFFQLYLAGAVAAYFLWYWLHGGQTLPMKTWRLRLVSTDGNPISLKQACLRFMLAAIGVASGLSIIWALFDRDRQFLHDRLAGTKLVMSEGVRGVAPLPITASPPATSSLLPPKEKPMPEKLR